jgi:hypothetical protein
MKSRIREEYLHWMLNSKCVLSKVNTTITAKKIDELKGKYISENGRIVYRGSIFSS